MVNKNCFLIVYVDRNMYRQIKFPFFSDTSSIRDSDLFKRLLANLLRSPMFLRFFWRLLRRIINNRHIFERLKALYMAKTRRCPLYDGNRIWMQLWIVEELLVKIVEFFHDQFQLRDDSFFFLSPCQRTISPFFEISGVPTPNGIPDEVKRRISLECACNKASTTIYQAISGNLDEACGAIQHAVRALLDN
jgi:hypothetical protein